MDVKLRILKESGELFSRYGLRSITMEHIANELGVSKRTLYEIFKDKDDLILQSIEEGTKAHKKVCFEQIENSDNIVDAIFKIARLNNDIFKKINPVFFEDLKKYHSRINDKVFQKGTIRDYSLSKSLLERGVSENIIRDDINIDVVNIFIHKCADIINSDELIHASKDDIRQSVFMPYLMGISTNKGIELIKKYLNNNF